MNIRIDDTSGQEKFRYVNLNYFRKCDCIFLIYDITDRQSFDLITNYYIEAIKLNCKKNITVLLIGNKADLENERKVPKKEAAELANKNNYIYIEISCLKNMNVRKAFEICLEITSRNVA